PRTPRGIYRCARVCLEVIPDARADGLGGSERAMQHHEGAATPPPITSDRSGVRTALEDRRDTIQDGMPLPETGEVIATIDAEARLGQVVADQWYLQRVIGTGSVAAVYEATHVDRAERAAVKVLHPAAEKSREAKLRFLREAHVAAGFRHRHIVQILDSGRDADGTLYQVQELLEGEDLATALLRGPLSLDRAIAVGCQLLSALAEVHQAELVHRDIKPENVFLSRAFGGPAAVKLLDFGIAKHLDPEDGLRTITLRGMVLGTPQYMSPEQIVGDTLTPRSDLWAVGAVLFHALTGRPPFDADDLGRLAQKITCEPAPSLAVERPDLPSNVSETVDRALVHESRRRWANAADMATALAHRDGARPQSWLG
ncbi:MAG: serine/threonine-protein kinase, partial [Polyangiales bacterium]